jgi:hypothetical protein
MSIEMTTVCTTKACIVVLFIFLCSQMVPGAISERDAEISQLIDALKGESAVAEWHASRRLMELGDAAVPTVAQLVSTPGRLAPRLVAVEVLGGIGTETAMDALLGILRQEKDLAVRGQICMQLGDKRERRAVPVIAKWLAGIGPRSLDDVPGPKEVQPSTCYIRHAEALGMIGDESAVPILKEFRGKIPQNIGYGGFVTGFLTTAVDQALEDIEDNSAFWGAVGMHDGLADSIAPVFRYFRSSNLAELRLYESEVVRRTKEGKVILLRLAKRDDPELATAARALLQKYDDLAIQE